MNETHTGAEWREPPLKKLADDEQRKAAELQDKMLALIDAKNNKILTKYLAEHDHTQLSFMSKDDQRTRLAVGKQSILQHIINFLNKL